MELHQELLDEGTLHPYLFALPLECLDALKPVLDHHRCNPLYLGASPLYAQLLPDILIAERAEKLQRVLYHSLLCHRAQVRCRVVPGDAEAEFVREAHQGVLLQKLVVSALFSFQVARGDVEKGSQAKEGKPVL